MRTSCVKNCRVMVVILLFVGVAVQPSVATVQPEEEIINIEPKDYLFQTIIDIVNNPNVKNLLEQYKYELFKVDIDRSVYRKIFFRNPKLLRQVIFTKPSISKEYFNFACNHGTKIINILGEDEALDIIESIEVTDKEALFDFEKIIMNNKWISDNLTKLKEMNKELKQDEPLMFYPILCATSIIPILLVVVITGPISLTLIKFYEKIYEIFHINIIGPFFVIINTITWLIIFPFFIASLFFCGFFY